MNYNVNLSENEVRTVYAVFESLKEQFTDNELNKFIGSVTIKEMNTLISKIRTNEYCKEHGIAYEEMTDDDYYDYAEWEANKREEEACEAFYDKKKCNMKDCITVIRCKNCKYYNKGFCENINGILAEVATNEYCSRAERKENDNG